MKRHERNRQFRSRLRRALKTCRTAIDTAETDKAEAAVVDTCSLIDKMAGKGIIHDNAASRYKSRLARRLAGRSVAG
jgi:small subunit ribosomal protein S20